MEEERNLEKLRNQIPIGSIMAWMDAVAPENWLILDGSTISREEYPELFELYGTKYGEGDGTTTFNLPNLKGKVLTGFDVNQNEFNALGKTGGDKTHAHEYGIALGGYNGDIAFEGSSDTGAIDFNKGWTTSSGWMNNGSYTIPVNNAAGNGAINRTVNRYLSFGYTSQTSSLAPYIVTNYIVKAKEIVFEEVPEKGPFFVHCTKAAKQSLNSGYQRLTLQNIVGDTDKLVLDNNEIIVNYDLKYLVMNTNWQSDLTGTLYTKIYRERNNQKEEIKNSYTSGSTSTPQTFIVNVEKGDKISIEIAYSKIDELDINNQTYLDVLAF